MTLRCLYALHNYLLSVYLLFTYVMVMKILFFMFDAYHFFRKKINEVVCILQ